MHLYVENKGIGNWLCRGQSFRSCHCSSQWLNTERPHPPWITVIIGPQPFLHVFDQFIFAVAPDNTFASPPRAISSHSLPLTELPRAYWEVSFSLHRSYACQWGNQDKYFLTEGDWLTGEFPVQTQALTFQPILCCCLMQNKCTVSKPFNIQSGLWRSQRWCLKWPWVLPSFANVGCDGGEEALSKNNPWPLWIS